MRFHPLRQADQRPAHRQRQRTGGLVHLLHVIQPQHQRLPASYANFYIANQIVLVPTYRQKKKDKLALEILRKAFPHRKVIGIDSTELIWGLGSFHCISQQEPA